jgi:hypothetical protein
LAPEDEKNDKDTFMNLNVTQLILVALILSSQVVANDLISAKAFSRMKKAISEKTDNAWDIVLKDASIEFTFKKAFEH